MRSVAAIAIVAGLSTALVVQAQTVLSAEVIKQSFAGNTGEIVGSQNSTFVYWAPDGSQRMQNARGADTGNWRITAEGDFCGKWVRLRNGAEACFPVIDTGGSTYQWGDTRFRVLLGNPKGL